MYTEYSFSCNLYKFLFCHIKKTSIVFSLFNYWFFFIKKKTNFTLYCVSTNNFGFSYSSVIFSTSTKQYFLKKKLKKITETFLLRYNANFVFNSFTFSVKITSPFFFKMPKIFFFFNCFFLKLFFLY